MTKEQVIALHEAVEKLIAELRGAWPVPYQRAAPAKPQHMIGYCRERGRRPVID
jgi:hypothetical protein